MALPDRRLSAGWSGGWILAASVMDPQPAPRLRASQFSLAVPPDLSNPHSHLKSETGTPTFRCARACRTRQHFVLLRDPAGAHAPAICSSDTIHTMRFSSGNINGAQLAFRHRIDCESLMMRYPSQIFIIFPIPRAICEKIIHKHTYHSSKSLSPRTSRNIIVYFVLKPVSVCTICSTASMCDSLQSTNAPSSNYTYVRLVPDI